MNSRTRSIWPGIGGRRAVDSLSMVASHKPAVSVVIPTYNWSAALRCAIRSVLLQTMQDFEILVVGDGCTDDSEAVVAEFKDPRIRWHNLERNYGSQWKANNYANEHAAGDWIAYLGHDDIWYPTHLEAMLRAAKSESADAVTSTMILYWPEETGGRSIAGLYATGAFTTARLLPAVRLRACAGDVWRGRALARPGNRDTADGRRVPERARRQGAHVRADARADLLQVQCRLATRLLQAEDGRRAGAACCAGSRAVSISARPS